MKTLVELVSRMDELGDREAVRTVRGPVERDEKPVLDLVGDVVLEPHGEAVGLVPRVAEHVGEEPLDDAVAADRADRRLATVVGEFHAAVRLVIDQPAVGQSLHRRGDRAGREAQALGEIAGVGVTVPGEAVDRLQRLAIAFREGIEQVFDDGESRFRSPKSKVQVSR